VELVTQLGNNIDGILMSSSGATIINNTGWTYLIRGKAIGALVYIRL